MLIRSFATNDMLRLNPFSSRQWQRLLGSKRQKITLVWLLGIALQLEAEIDFEQDIQPIFERNCLQCHGPQRAKGRYRMDTREYLLRGGTEGTAVIPGDAAGSSLVIYIKHLEPTMEMPPIDEGEPLSPAEIALISDWIDQGALWSSTTQLPPEHLSFQTSTGFVTVEGNKNRFREHHHLRDRSLGIENFQYARYFDQDTSLQLEGKVYTQGPVDLAFNLDKQDLGFVRGGFEYFQNFSNDVGGFYAPFDLPAPSLDRELILETGRMWTQLGFERSEQASVIFGYEYLFKDGDRSTLYWGPIAVGSETRHLSPSFKNINEDIHRITLDILREKEGLRLENYSRAEFVSRETSRLRGDTFASPGTNELVHQEQESLRLANSFSIHKSLYDWWRVSAGHHYSFMDTEASFEKRTVDSDLRDQAFGEFIFTSPISLDAYTHAFNVNTLFGPWNDLTLTFGLQGYLEDREAVGAKTTFFDIPAPTAFSFSTLSNTQRESIRLREQATLRFTGLPYATLYAEAYLEQEDIELFEEELLTDSILRETHSDSHSQDYRLGASLRPFNKLSAHLRFRYTKDEDEYDHLRDEAYGFANIGYPAFIDQLKRETHETKLRFNIRPSHWLNANLAFQYVSTDYANQTDASATKTSFQTGEYDSMRYNLNLSLTRWERLSLYSNFSIQDTMTRTFADAPDSGDPLVADYGGTRYSAQFGGHYQFKDKTLLSGNYSYSRADFSQSRTETPLPLGIDYQQHTVQLGIKRQLTESMAAEFQYYTYYYDEPTSGGANDYQAHGIFLNLHFKWL